jgi:hypothetical protein
MLTNALRPHALPLARSDVDAIAVVSNVAEWNGDIRSLQGASPFHFKAPPGWTNHLERSSAS